MPRANARRSLDEARGSIRSAAIGLFVGTLVVASNAVGSTVLELITALIAMVVALLSPPAGLAALTLAAPLVRPLVIPPPGLYVAMLGAILFSYLLRLPITRQRLSLPKTEVLLLGAFLVYVAAQLVGGRVDGPPEMRSSEITSLFARLAEAVLTFGVAYIVLRCCSPYGILAVTLLAAVAAAVLAIAQVVGAEGVFGDLVDPAGGSGRASGAFADPNYFGSYLAAMIVLAAACAITTTSARLRLLLFMVASFLGLTLMLTQSRGALVALAAGVVVLSFTRSRRAGVLAVAGSSLLAILAYPIFVQWRFGETSAGLADLSMAVDSSGRTEAWSAGLDLFVSSPIFGVGFRPLAGRGHGSDRGPQLVRSGLGGTWHRRVLVVGFLCRSHPSCIAPGVETCSECGTACPDRVADGRSHAIATHALPNDGSDSDCRSGRRSRRLLTNAGRHRLG